MSPRNPDKGSFSKKNTGPKSERTSKKTSYGGKPSFPKKKDSPKGKEAGFNKSKPAGFKKKEFDKDSDFEKKSSYPKREFNKNSSFEKKPYTGKKEFGAGKGKSYPDKKEFGTGKGKPYPDKKDSFTKRDSGKKFSRKDDGFKKDFSKSDSKSSDFKKKSFSGPGKKSSDFKKKDFPKGPVKDFETPQYNFKKPLRAKKESDPIPSSDQMRLNRYISNAGVCSRRDADQLIELGEITVNGKVVTEMGYKVNRDDVVKYNGKTISPEKPVYILLNKPKDFITTTDDPQDRKTVMALVENACKERVYPVGRLDRNTTGLLLLTNDGELAKKLTHPSSNVKKLYQADLDKPLTREDFDKIAEGIELEDGPAHVDALAYVTTDKKSVGIEIHIGRNRIVRRIFEHLGYDVVRLDRVMFAGLTKKDLPRGKWKFLSEKEVIQLKYFL